MEDNKCLFSGKPIVTPTPYCPHCGNANGTKSYCRHLLKESEKKDAEFMNRLIEQPLFDIGLIVFPWNR